MAKTTAESVQKASAELKKKKKEKAEENKEATKNKRKVHKIVVEEDKKKKAPKTRDSKTKDDDSDEEEIEAMNISEAWAAQQKDIREGKAMLDDFKVKVDSLVDSYDQQAAKIKEQEKTIGLYEQWLKNIDPGLSKCPLPLMHKLNAEAKSAATNLLNEFNAEDNTPNE